MALRRIVLPFIVGGNKPERVLPAFSIKYIGQLTSTGGNYNRLTSPITDNKLILSNLLIISQLISQKTSRLYDLICLSFKKTLFSHCWPRFLACFCVCMTLFFQIEINKSVKKTDSIVMCFVCNMNICNALY